MANIEKDISRYCYDTVLSAIQYTKDSDKWSPNNIRRLIIGADAVAVQLHTSKQLIVKPFVKDKMYQCSISDNYKPMVSALTDRVCSSVEEIIFCTGSQIGLKLNQAELDLRSIVASRKATTNEELLKDAIKSRFKRLRAVLIVNQTISQYCSAEGVNLNDHCYQSSDNPQIRANASVIDMHKDDWFKGYYLREKDYRLDREGGVLYNILHKVEKDITAQINQKKISDSKNKHLGDLISKVKESEAKVLRILIPYRNLSLLFKSSPLVSIYSADNQVNYFVSLRCLCTDVSLPNPDNTLSTEFKNTVTKLGAKVTTEVGDSKSQMNELLQTLNSLYANLYLSLCNQFLSYVVTSGTQYPIMTKVKLSNKDRVVYIPSQLEGVALEASQYFPSPLEGKLISDSVANICSISCSLFLSDTLNTAVGKYFNKAYWLELCNTDKKGGNQ